MSDGEVIYGERKILEALRFSDSIWIGDNTKVVAEEVAEGEVKQRLIRLTRHVYTDQIAEEHYHDSAAYYFPSSPWQFFKQRHQDSWWLDWFVRRWPVQTDTKIANLAVTVGRYVGYPDLQVREDALGKSVIYEPVRLEKWWE